MDVFFFFFHSLMQYFTCALFLVSTTITERTTNRCTTKIVHIIWTTISHIDVCWPFTAAWCPVKTHRPGDLTICYCGVSTIQPAGCMSATSVIRWTWSWHSCAGGPLETKPTRSDSTVTITATGVRNLSGITVKASVILTFWYIKKQWFNFLFIVHWRIAKYFWGKKQRAANATVPNWTSGSPCRGRFSTESKVTWTARAAKKKTTPLIERPI